MRIKTILAVVVTAMAIFSCNDARKSETYRLLVDVDSYIEARPGSALAVKYYENHCTPDERLKMYYYSGHIKQNSGDSEGAMENDTNLSNYLQVLLKMPSGKLL